MSLPQPIYLLQNYDRKYFYVDGLFYISAIFNGKSLLSFSALNKVTDYGVHKQIISYDYDYYAVDGNTCYEIDSEVSLHKLLQQKVDEIIFNNI